MLSWHAQGSFYSSGKSCDCTGAIATLDSRISLAVLGRSSDLLPSNGSSTGITGSVILVLPALLPLRYLLLLHLLLECIIISNATLGALCKFLPL